MKTHTIFSTPIVRLLWTLILGIACVFAANAQVYERVFSFTDARAGNLVNMGNNPASTLVQGNDGNFYGTTVSGGSNNQGTVFRMTPGGVISTLAEFTGITGNNKGANPEAGLVQGYDGNFYGTTNSGGSSGYGTVFRITAVGVMTTLTEFTGITGSNKGRYPCASLVLGNDGNFYGTTSQGGSNNYGTVFRITPAGGLTSLVEFTGTTGNSKGSNPYASLVQGNDGNFYGTTGSGGVSDGGTVFRMTPSGMLTTLAEFGSDAGNPGTIPRAELVQAGDGNFYGTTSQGGAKGNGTTFKITPGGLLTPLVDFIGITSQVSALVQSSNGNFYGTTSQGGAGNYGTVFKMTSTGELTTLVEFTGIAGTNLGSNPVSATLVQSSDGNLYGTTGYGGTSNYGTVFKMTPDGVLTTLVEFTGTASNIGSEPAAPLIQCGDGNFYGTTYQGGSNNYGTVFKITPAGTLTTLVEFTGNSGNYRGAEPFAGMVQDSAGNLYGTTTFGGVYNFGTVFRITPAGILTTLVEFTGTTGANKGLLPYAALVRGSDGGFYGTTRRGGANNNGTVFKMTSAGILTTLVDFTGNGSGNKGSESCSVLTQGSDGNFYGTTYQGGTANYGTVFKMSPTGVLTTLAEFTGTAGNNIGSGPVAGLLLGNDGNFYGTTTQGGSSNNGTVFKMTPNGALTTLVEFSGTVGSNLGSGPFAALIQGSDGNFYGTTQKGGATGTGTVFKMTPNGVLTTLKEFSAPDCLPYTPLFQATDGTFYGSTWGPSGAIYRLLFPGAPLFFPRDPLVQGTSTALVQTSLNARGSLTTISLEYGTDGVNFPTAIPVATRFGDFLTQLVGATLKNLNSGTTYYYRFRGISSAGTTVSSMQSFSTLAAPLVTVVPASNILPTSATFNGTVNARNYDSAVHFEYGTDGNTFPISVPAVPGTVTGNTATSVSVAVAGLTKGTTYYYRIVAINAGGTIVSGQSTFRTLTEPTATVGGAVALSTTSVQLSGSLNAQGAVTQIVFEYGTDGTTFPNSVAAVPPTANGESDTPVSAVLTNLAQGSTYYYRIKGTSAGGIGTSSAASFRMATLSGLTQVFPGAPASSLGLVLVTLNPASFPNTTLLPGWRFVGEQQWRGSGGYVSGLTSGNRQIEYRPVPGYFQPMPETISVVSGGPATVFSRDYYVNAGGATGGLNVTLKPDSVAGTGLPVAQRAQWRLQGEDDTQWRNSGVTAGTLPSGTYLVESKPLTGYATPAPLSVTVRDGVTSVAVVTYFLPDAATGTAPLVVPFQTVTSATTMPYAYVGQLQSDAGSATGFVVASRVVATAAHVVFDDGTLAAATGLQWLLERAAGTYEPAPLVPRGFYTFTGYAAQRTAEGTPGQSSPASQNLDAAALYFLSDAGNGGYSGYLASDATDNEFLLSGANKMLIGYPVNGFGASSQGQMFATSASNVSFSRVPGLDTTGTAYRLYATTNITSSGGNSGGPLCVLHTNGTYYPAAIYLGGAAETVVRAIDGNMVDMFNRAVTSGNGGGNNNSGGISQTNSPIAGGSTTVSSLQVTLTPAGLAGAGWRLKGGNSFRTSGNMLSGLTPGKYTLQFSTVAGYGVPADQDVTLPAGQQANVEFIYTDISPPAITSALTLSGTGGQPLTYQIVASHAPDTYAAASLPVGLTVNATTGLISGTPQVVGTFSVPITAGNAYGIGGNTLVITLTSPFTAWQSATFGANAGNPAIAGDSVVNNKVGIRNLMAYALGINPFTANGTGLPTGNTPKVSGTNYLALNFKRNSGAVDLTYTVEVNNNPANPNGWTPVATYSAGAWSGSGTVSETGSAPYYNVQVLDPQPVTTTPKRFFRLKVSH